MFPFVNPINSFGGNGNPTSNQSGHQQQPQMMPQQMQNDPQALASSILAQNTLFQSLAAKLSSIGNRPNAGQSNASDLYSQLLLNPLLLMPNALSSMGMNNLQTSMQQGQQIEQTLTLAKAQSTSVNGMLRSSSLSEKDGEVRVGTEEKEVRMKQRLARNRTTARLRRERKKQEAETLTRVVAALDLRCKEYEARFHALEGKELEKAKKIVQGYGEPDLPCRFCTLTFKKKGDMEQHEKLNHGAEIKAREQFYIESRTFGMPTNSPDDCKFSDTLSEEENIKLSRLTSEERKKRRLERNAASARLCRQRKKIYIESLRVQLPGMIHKVKALESALPADVVEEVRRKCPVPGEADGDIYATCLAACTEDDADSQDPVRTQSEENSDLGKSHVGTLPGFGCAKRKSISGNVDDLSPSTGSISGKRIRSDTSESVASVKGQIGATNNDPRSRGRALSGDLPPLSGWSKSQRPSKETDDFNFHSQVPQRQGDSCSGRDSSESLRKVEMGSFSSPLTTMPGFSNSNMFMSGIFGAPGISPLLQSVYPQDLVLPPRNFKLEQQSYHSQSQVPRPKQEGQVNFDADVAGALALTAIRSLAPSK